MRQRLDIADVEQRTKIRAKYLRALENEEFGMLPGPTFVKTFLRTYAEMLGLDPHVLVEEYRANYEGQDELELSRSDRRPPWRGSGRARAVARAGDAGAARAGGGGGVLVVIGVLSNDGGDGQSAARTETTTERTTTQPKKETPPPPTRVALRVVPATPTYVCVDRGAGTPVVFEGTIDTPRRFHGKRVRVNLGQARRAARGRTASASRSTPGADPVGFAFTPQADARAAGRQRPCVRRED